MKIHLIKKIGGGLYPAFDSDYEKAKKLKLGEVLQCNVTKPRNYEFHKKYFALLNMLYDNQEIYKDIEDLRRDLTIESGHYKLYYDMHGEEKKVAKSISFASMNEFEFRDFYDANINTIVKYFNFDKQSIIDNVAQYF